MKILLLNALFCLLFNPFVYSQSKIIELSELNYSGNWRVFGKTETFNNSQGQTDSLLTYLYNETEAKFNNSNKFHFWYNGFGQRILSNSYYWNNNTNEFKLTNRVEDDIDRDSFIINKSNWTFYDGVFRITTILKVFYDSAFKNDLRLERYAWDNNNQDFYLELVEIKKYNLNGDLDSHTTFIRNTRSSELKMRDQAVYKHNNNYEKLIYINSLDSNEQIVSQVMRRSFYNYDNELFLDEFFYYNTMDSIWQPDSKIDYSYKNGELLEKLISDFDFTYNIYIPRSRYRYEKVNLFLMKDNPFEIVNGFYPNPSKDKITFIEGTNLALIEIYDLNGRLIISKKFDNKMNNEMDISELNSGIYLVNIIENSGLIHSKKLIKN